MNKKIAMICIVLIVNLMAIPLIFGMDFDNTKSFEKDVGDYGKVIIENWFGFGGIISELELEENTDTCAIDCYSETQIVMYKKGVLIDEVRFMTLQSSGGFIEQKIRSYEFYIKNGNQWQIYNLGEEVEPGTYYIRLEGKKKPDRSVDWQITSQGKLIDDWALWGLSAEIILANYTKNDDQSIIPREDLWNAQSFSVSEVSQLNKISLLAQENGNSEDITIGIRATDGSDDPTGSDLTSVTFDGSIYTASDTWLNFTFDDPLELEPNVNYTFVIRCPLCDVPNSIDIRLDDSSSPYVAGKSYSSANSGVSWTPSATVDILFRLFGNLSGIVTLNSPVDSFLSSVIDVSFNCSATITGGGTLANMSLFHNGTGTWSMNQTNVTTGNTNTTIFTTTIIDPTLWNCQACDSDSSCGFADTNRTITSDLIAPDIIISQPTGILNSNFFGANETLNFTITDPNLDSCWFEYNVTNTTINGCESGTNNLTFFPVTNQRTIRLYANDSLGKTNSNSTSWGYKAFINSQTFNNLTTEGAKETFSINFTKASLLQVSTVDLFHNGTIYSFPYSVNGNEVISESSIVIPSRASPINTTFFWNITLNDGSSINTSLQNQTIDIIDVDDCTVFGNLIYNFTQYEEANKSQLIGTNMEIQMNLFDLSKTETLIEFSQNFTNVNPAQICLEDSILQTVNYSSYVIVKYFANLTNQNASYSIEYHNILNETIGNGTIPLNKALYNLRESDTTKFRLTFRDDAYILAPNILVQVHRQYISDNDFKIVEIPLTDSSGQTILNLVKNDIIYNFIMVNEGGEVVATFNSQTAFCQDFTIGSCTINLVADPVGDDAYDYNEEFGISISSPIYNNVTKLISISFITDNLLPKTVSLSVVRNNDFGNRSVCSNSITASSGTLSCGASSISDIDQYLFTQVNVGGELATQDTINLNAETLRFGTLNGAFYAFLLILFLITMFMEDRKVLVVSLALGWVVIISLGLMSGALVGATSAGIWILITVAIFLWKLNKEETLG